MSGLNILIDDVHTVMIKCMYIIERDDYEMTVSTKLFKNGNSLAVRLNQNILKTAGLKNNDEVDIQVDHATGNIIISPKVTEVDDNFKDLLNYSMKRDKDSLEFLKDR